MKSLLTRNCLHRLDIPGRLVWVLVNTILAAFGGGVLAFGLFEAGWPVVILSGACSGLLVGGLWLRQQMAASAGEQSAARRCQRGMILATIMLLAVVGLLSIYQLYNAGVLQQPGQTRQENFKQLWRAMQAQYPYFAEKGVDWDAVYMRYLPQVQAAQSNAEYHALVAEMLTELGDAHTGVIEPVPNAARHYFGTGLLLEDSVAADRLGQTALAGGLKRGAQILAVGGLPVDAALDAIPVILRNGSTSRQSRYWAAFHILSTSGETLEITFRNPGESGQTVILRWPQNPPASSAAASQDADSLTTGERLASGFGLLRVPSFSNSSGHNLVKEFDVALDELLDTPGLILDLRGNGGGDSRIADAIAGRFFKGAFCYGEDRFRLRLPQLAWRLNWDYCVRPRGQVYSAPLVLLIDTGNMSTAEQFIVALTSSGRADTVGRFTGGASGNPVTFRLSAGGLARFSTAAFYTRNGALIEGMGIAPSVYVPYTLEDYRLDRDPDLDVARQVLARIAALADKIQTWR